jgi:hypothetical protein
MAGTLLRGMAVLQMIFGLTMTNLSTYLRFGRRIVIEVLKNDPDATICLPTENEMQQYTQAIALAADVGCRHVVFVVQNADMATCRADIASCRADMSPTLPEMSPKKRRHFIVSVVVCRHFLQHFTYLLIPLSSVQYFDMIPSSYQRLDLHDDRKHNYLHFDV